MKRCVLFFVLVCLTTAGLFRIQLVAKDSADEEESVVSEDFEQRVSGFAAKIHVDDNDLMRDFQQNLRSRPGMIVLKDRAAHFEDMLREQAQSEAAPSYIEEHFVKDGNRFRLRDGHDSFRSGFIQACGNFNDDVERMRPVARAIASKIVDEGDANRLAARFLNYEAAPAVLYVHELRARLRPDITLIQQHLGELFVANEKGEYVLRAARRGEAQRFLRNSQRASKALKHLKAELKDWSKDFAEKDQFHKELKQAMAHPRFASLVAIQIFEDPEGNVEERLDGFFGDLEEISRDTADGLVLTDEGHGHAEEILGEYRRVRLFGEKLKTPLTRFADRIQSGDDLQNEWKTFLHSDIASTRLAMEIGPTSSDPADALSMLLHEVFNERDDGTFELRGEEQEEAVEFIRGMFRFFREIRRKGRFIDEFAQQLDDPELCKAYASLAGKFTVMRSIEQLVAKQQFDGLTKWINDHFEETDDGLVLRDGASEEIQSIFEDVRQVKKELEKDDF